MPSRSSRVYKLSIGRPEIVVKLCVRSGDFFSVGSSVSRCQRCFSVSATVFIHTHYSERLAAALPPCYPIGVPRRIRSETDSRNGRAHAVRGARVTPLDSSNKTSRPPIATAEVNGAEHCGTAIAVWATRVRSPWSVSTDDSTHSPKNLLPFCFCADHSRARRPHGGPIGRAANGVD